VKKQSEPLGAPVTVPWGMTWRVGPHLFRIEDVVDIGRVIRTEAYAIGRPGAEDEMHNPIGHFSGSRRRCWDELRRMARIYHCQPGERCPCQLYPSSTCADARAFLAVELPEEDLNR
jgi:hypothetical protein